MKEIIKKYPGEVINFELYKKIIEKIIKQRKLNKPDSSLQLVLHGGEPLLAGKQLLYKMLDYTRSKFVEENLLLELGIQTNASLIDDDYAKMFNKFDVNVGLSFDGINSDKSRDIKIDIFEEKFELFKKNNVHFGILLVLGKHNIDNISETVNYLQEKGIKTYKFSYAEDMFNPGINSKIELDGATLFKKAFKIMLDKFLETGELDEFYTKELLQRSILDIILLNPPLFKTGCGGKICGSTINMVSVDPDGTSRYCDRWADEYDEIYVMNALDYDFLGLYQLKRALDFALIKHRAILERGCDTCYADYMCNHGCISFYYSKYGKWGIDKRIVCPLHKLFYSYVLENIDRFLLKLADVNYRFTFNRTNLKIKQNIQKKLLELNIKVESDEKSIKISR